MAAAIADASSDPTRKTLWSAVLLLAAILFASALMRMVFSPLQEAAKLDLKLSDFAISLVQGLALGAPVAIVSIPLAWIIDHGHRVRLLVAVLAIGVVGAVWTAFATGLTTLFLARVLTALGASCAVPVVISLMADLCAPQQRGRAMVLVGLGAYAGTAAAFGVAGLLLNVLVAHPVAALGAMAPWRATHLLVASAGTLLLLPLVMVREPARHEVQQQTTSLGPAIRTLWAKRSFLFPLFAGQIGVSMADAAAGIWATPVLIRHYHLQPAAVAGWLGGLLFVAVLATALGIPAALFPIMPSVGGFQVMFFLLLLAGTTTTVVVSTAVTVLIPNEERGASMAIFAVISAIVGTSLAPTLVTLCSALMGGEGNLAPSLAAVGVLTGVISLAGYIQAMRSAPKSATEWR